MKKIIASIKGKSFTSRLLIFLGCVAIWFLVTWVLNSSFQDPLAKANNLNSLWFLSAVIIAWFYYTIVYQKK